MQVILTTHPINEQARVGFVGMSYGINHQLDERIDNTETGQLNIQHITRTVNLLHRHFGATFISLSTTLARMLDERLTKRTIEDFLFVAHKGVGTFIDKNTYHLGTQVSNLLVMVSNHIQHLGEMALLAFLDEGRE